MQGIKDKWNEIKTWLSTNLLEVALSVQDKASEVIQGIKDKWDNFVAHLTPNYKYNGGHNGGINYYTMIPRWLFFTPLAKKQDIETKKTLGEFKTSRDSTRITSK